MLAAKHMPVLFAAALLLLAVPPARAEVVEKFARIVPLSPDMPVSLQVTVGNVAVSAWDRQELSVEVVRRAPASADLVRIPASVEQTGDSVIVRAVQADDGRDAGLRTDVVLRVPAAAHLRELAVFEGRIELSNLSGISTARIERGDIVGKGVSGAVRLETSIGSIRLERARLAADGLLRLRTFNGDVTLGLAVKPEHARILALSMGGTIRSELPLTMKDRSGPRWGEATIGNGQPLISIDVVNGNIAITVAAEER